MEKHTITKLEEGLISILIETFKNHGWTIDELPTIFDSDEDSKISNNDLWDFDKLLGVYRQKDEKWCDKGEVVLFTNNIEAVAKRFYEHDQVLRNPETGEIIYSENGQASKKSKLFHFIVEWALPDYGVKIESAIEYLKALVLIHELTHWMIHWNSDFNQKSLRCDEKYKEEDQINFHEGLAQYFTDYVINAHGNEKIKELFNFLKDMQSDSYRVFEKLKEDLDEKNIEISSIFTALAICWMKNYDQSFELLKKYNYLSVLYYPNDHITSYKDIFSNKKPAIDQEKISNWFSKTPFDFPDILLVDYFDEKNQRKYEDEIRKRKLRNTSIKYGLL